MQIELTSEQEVQLSQIAAGEGKDAEEIAREIFTLGLEAAAGAKFQSAVKIGQDAARGGDFMEPAEAWAGVEAALQS